MSDKEFIEKLTDHLKGHAKMFTPGNNWVLGPNNRTAEGIAEWVVEFLKQEDIKY
mgnify:CR=1 FL=1